jgi:hypothetical protein
LERRKREGEENRLKTIVSKILHRSESSYRKYVRGTDEEWKRLKTSEQELT